MSDETALNEAAQALGRARWAGTTERERRKHMRWLAAQRKNPHLFRRKSDAERCPCGTSTLHRAQLRAFDCCKKAGLMDRVPQRGRPHKRAQ